jgi:hypothetical protein
VRSAATGLARASEEGELGSALEEARAALASWDDIASPTGSHGPPGDADGAGASLQSLAEASPSRLAASPPRDHQRYHAPGTPAALALSRLVHAIEAERADMAEAVMEAERRGAALGTLSQAGPRRSHAGAAGAHLAGSASSAAGPVSGTGAARELFMPQDSAGAAISPAAARHMADRLRAELEADPRYQPDRSHRGHTPPPERPSHPHRGRSPNRDLRQGAAPSGAGQLAQWPMSVLDDGSERASGHTSESTARGRLSQGSSNGHHQALRNRSPPSSMAQRVTPTRSHGAKSPLHSPASADGLGGAARHMAFQSPSPDRPSSMVSSVATRSTGGGSQLGALPAAAGATPAADRMSRLQPLDLASPDMRAPGAQGGRTPRLDDIDRQTAMLVSAARDMLRDDNQAGRAAMAEYPQVADGLRIALRDLEPSPARLPGPRPAAAVQSAAPADEGMSVDKVRALLRASGVPSPAQWRDSTSAAPALPRAPPAGETSARQGRARAVVVSPDPAERWGNAFLGSIETAVRDIRRSHHG